MPSTMIHLLLAEKIAPQAPTDYFIGNVAPDAIAVRENHHYKDKDILHFRGSSTRLADIENLADNLDMTNPYCTGYIMHLFLDMHWDRDCMQPYITDRKSSDWVVPYRQEISKASSWLFNNNASLNRIWNDMIDYREPINQIVQGITYAEVQKYYTSNNIWYLKYKEKPSWVYPNDFVEKYTDEVAQKYLRWQKG